MTQIEMMHTVPDLELPSFMDDDKTPVIKPVDTASVFTALSTHLPIPPLCELIGRFCVTVRTNLARCVACETMSSDKTPIEMFGGRCTQCGAKEQKLSHCQLWTSFVITDAEFTKWLDVYTPWRDEKESDEQKLSMSGKRLTQIVLWLSSVNSPAFISSDHFNMAVGRCVPDGCVEATPDIELILRNSTAKLLDSKVQPVRPVEPELLDLKAQPVAPVAVVKHTEFASRLDELYSLYALLTSDELRRHLELEPTKRIKSMSNLRQMAKAQKLIS